MSGETDDREVLERSLAAAAQRPARNFFKQPGDGDERAHTVLVRVVQAIEGERAWQRSPSQSFLSVLRRAIAELPEEMSGRPTLQELKAHRRTKDGAWHYTGKWKGSPAQRIANILFGERDNDPEIKPRFGHENQRLPLTYKDDYLPAAHKLANVTTLATRTRERPIKVIREDLVDILLTLEQKALEAQEGTQTATVVPTCPLLPSPSATPFIPRPSLDEQFNALWNTALTDSRWDRPDVLCLVGEPGMGKTRYVKELPAAADAVWIDATSPDSLSGALADVLEQHDVPISSLDTPRLKREFAKLLDRPDSPALAVIDGIRDPKEIDVWIPRSAQARLIITSQKRPEEGWSPVLLVGEMTQDEGARMVRSLLPAADEHEATSLAAALGGRPLAIEQACKFLRRNPAFTTASLVNGLARNTDTALRPIATSPDAAQTVIYRDILTTLEAKHPGSHQLLRLLAFVPPLAVPRQLVMSFLARRLLIQEHERDFHELSYTAAMDPLLELSLVEETGLGVRINSLTQRILQDLVWADALDIMDHYTTATEATEATEATGYRTLEDSGWSLSEIASLQVANALFCTRVLAVIFFKAPSDGEDQLPYRLGRVLTTNEWSALSDALWERRYRVTAIEHLLRLGGDLDEDELLTWMQPHLDAIEEKSAQIPGRDTWLERVNRIDAGEFMEWFQTSEIDREWHLARLKQDPEGSAMILLRLYQLYRSVSSHLLDPIVETRLGQVDLRELYPERESLE